MDGMEDKLGAILSNPQMMQQIMSIAQSLGQSSQPVPEEKPEPKPAIPEIDLSMIQKISGLANQSGIDHNQQALLKALSPYLSRERIARLERAMRAAKMARYASTFLSAGGLQLPSGR